MYPGPMSKPARSSGPPPTTRPRPRAAAMPAEARRAAIVAATVPLLLAHGVNVTTRQIAQAAGIAEGTIFRVFPDKDSLIASAIETAFDPAPVEQALDAIDRHLPLEARLTEAVDILQRRVTDIWNLVNAVGFTKAPENRRPPPLPGLASLFEADRDRLRLEPAAAAEALRCLTIGASHPALVHDEPLKPVEIVTLLLDGIRTGPR